MIQIATPISDLFSESLNADRLCGLSDCLECRDQTIDSTLEKQFLFHFDLQLIHPWQESDLLYLKKVKAMKPEVKLITFHVASCCTFPVLINSFFYPTQKSVMLTEGQMLEYAFQNVNNLRAIFGNHISIAVENNNYFPTVAYDIITNPDFISKIIKKTGIYFLFDLVHARVSHHNNCISSGAGISKSFDEYISGFPFDEMVQIHICGSDFQPGEIALDSHEVPQKIDWEICIEVMKNAKNLRYLTLEYYKDINKLEQTLLYCRDITHELS